MIVGGEKTRRRKGWNNWLSDVEQFDHSGKKSK